MTVNQLVLLIPGLVDAITPAIAFGADATSLSVESLVSTPTVTGDHEVQLIEAVVADRPISGTSRTTVEAEVWTVMGTAEIRCDQ